MCGIAGIFRVNGRVTSEDVAAVLKMMNAEVHRGPDDWGILLPEEALQNVQIQGLLTSFDKSHIRTYRGSVAAPAAVLGARRLSIIDLSPRGRMPMGTTDGRVWITYNGEIYNYQELREELESRGYGFHSKTDTETILHGYQEWGEEIVQHLRGMFAFAILDLRAADDPKLFLAKDRFSIKPLYWARKNCVLQFASEVRALMAGGLMPNEPEPRGFHGFLVLGSVPTPFTTVRDVFSLPAAHTLTIDDRTYSYPKPRRYWSLSKAGSLSISPREAAMEVRHLLDESIKMHLVSDVPLGVFLSGGIDSSAITALAAKHLPEALTSLCVTFDEAKFSEGEYAARAANRFGCKHIEVRLRSKEFVEDIPQILAAMDQPSVDGVNTYFVSKAARAAGLTVVLSGLGGDELFCGYPGFHTGPRLARWARIPGVRLGAAIIGAVGKRFGYDRLEKLEFLRESGALGPYLTLRGLFPPSHAAHLLGSGRFPLALSDLKRESLTSSDYAELEIALYLQNQLLRDSDVFGMAHSLEIRVPFLDHRLAEFVVALPESFKISGSLNKPLLLSALEGILDSETFNRPKMGFTFPFERWMREHRAAILQHTEPGTTVDAAQAKAIWDAFTEGRIHWSRPWAVSVLGGMTRLGNLPALAPKSGPERILFLLPEVYSSKGGIPVYNQALLRAIGETFPRSELRAISVNDTTIPANAEVFGRLHFTGCGPRRSAFLKPWVVLAALREMLRHRPDLIICGHINLSPLALLISALSGAHTALLAYGIDAWVPTPIHRWAARRIHRVFPISRYTADRMQAWGINRSCIQILPPTVDGEVFRSTRQRKTAIGTVLLTVARLDASERAKGVDLVIKVLRKVRIHHPTVRYVVAGKGDDLVRLVSLARELGVADRVKFLGHVPDEELPALYSEADLFVMPSWMEGFGIAFLEAMACNVPVIASSLEGSRDALLDGRVGMLVDPDSESELEIAICRILTREVDPSWLDGEFLRAEVLQAFGFNRFRELVRSSLVRLSA